MDKADYVPPKEVAPIVITERVLQPATQPTETSFKLPDDFGEKMEDIRKIMNMLQDLKNNFGIVMKKQRKKTNFISFNIIVFPPS